MTEIVLQFIKDCLPTFIGIGCGIGFLSGAFAVLIGYSISKIQGFFDT